MTPSLPIHTPRKPSLGAALANAEDEFETQVFAMFEGVTTRSVNADLLELETIARLVTNTAAGLRVLLDRLEYAGTEDRRYSLTELILDAIDHELDHGALSVVKAQVAIMESGK